MNFSGIFLKICVADLQRTISKNPLFFVLFLFFSYILQAVKFILYSFCWIFNNNVHKVILMVMINAHSVLQKKSVRKCFRKSRKSGKHSLRGGLCK